ncbi:hypothetical protein ACKVMT_00385 [Halobacteriales archaeon Cl-PHB]
MTTRLRLPVRRADWRLVGRTVRLVLGIPGYAALALVLALGALSLFVFSQNVPLLRFVLTGGLPLDARVTILVEQYPFVGTSYGVVTGLALLVVAGLSGVNLAVVTYHVREHGLSTESGGSAVGVFLGLLGAGCAACGTALLAGLLSLVGAAGLVTLLPFEGLELSGLAVVVLLLSLYWLAVGLRGGQIRGCPVDVAG